MAASQNLQNLRIAITIRIHDENEDAIALQYLA